MTLKKKIKLDIILPQRIGDCLLSLPAVFCLAELMGKYDDESYEVRLICGENMLPLIKKLNIFEAQKLSWQLKFQSWLSPKDKAFFLLSSSKTLGYKADLTYGQRMSTKKYLKFDVEVPYLHCEILDKFPDSDLLTLLKNEYLLSNVVISNFALCLSLGYDYHQIKQVLPLAFQKIATVKKVESNYLICSIEAGYEKKKCECRKWDTNGFIKIADYIYSKYGLKTAFIGLNKKTPILNKRYIVDCREKASINRLVEITSNSAGYFGNETGPLHLANFLFKPTLGIYKTTTPEIYGPIFTKNNYPVLNPKNIDDVLPIIDKMINDNRLSKVNLS